MPSEEYSLQKRGDLHPNLGHQRRNMSPERKLNTDGNERTHEEVIKNNRRGQDEGEESW